MSLTLAGLSNWMEVVGIIYAYLRLLTIDGGPPVWIYNELKEMSQLEYDYCDEEDDSDFVENLSVQLALFDKNGPPLELLPSDDIYYEWDQGGVLDVLSALAPCNSHVQLISSVFAQTPLCRHPSGGQCNISTPTPIKLLLNLLCCQM